MGQSPGEYLQSAQFIKVFGGVNNLASFKNARHRCFLLPSRQDFRQRAGKLFCRVVFVLLIVVAGAFCPMTFPSRSISLKAIHPFIVRNWRKATKGPIRVSKKCAQ
jgi:hypothetical protein